MKAKVKSSTLLEVLVSMVIILVVFTMTINVFNKIIFNRSTIDNIAIGFQLRKILYSSLTSNAGGEVQIDSILYVKEVIPYEDNTDLYEVSVKAYRNKVLVDQVLMVRRLE